MILLKTTINFKKVIQFALFSITYTVHKQLALVYGGDKRQPEIRLRSQANKQQNIGTLSVQELFFQLIGWLGVELGVSPVRMVYFMG